MELTVVPLHKNFDYTLDCCRLLNDEWKRSENARLLGLQCSCDTLPTSLILLKQNELIGHLKLSSIPSVKNACFVQSVVIDRKLRGQGYGSILMKRAEEYCKETLGVDTVYLSTKGQEQFYSKLGYKECPPISIYGYNNNPRAIAPDTNIQNCTEGLTAGPPPPPLPKPNSHTVNNNVRTYMKKEL